VTRVAALYDVHGNLAALEAVLAEVDADWLLLVGGDVASGPFPVEVLDRLRAYGSRVRFVRGNADRVLDFVGANDGEVWVRSRLWVAERLGRERLEFLAALPLDVTIDVEALGPVRFCHGAPGSDEIAITRITSDERLRGLLAGVEEQIVVCGHTHIQFERLLDATRVLNAGSVGIPYEGVPGAYWLELGPDVTFRRTEYDVEAAVAAITATGYPNAEQWNREIVDEDPGKADRMSALIEGA
jgi:diadenosine tetraphosphatase ApaH/serine/threonine PP2A family protein phosphatase